MSIETLSRCSEIKPSRNRASTQNHQNEAILRANGNFYTAAVHAGATDGREPAVRSAHPRAVADRPRGAAVPVLKHTPDPTGSSRPKKKNRTRDVCLLQKNSEVTGAYGLGPMDGYTTVPTALLDLPFDEGADRRPPAATARPPAAAGARHSGSGKRACGQRR